MKKFLLLLLFFALLVACGGEGIPPIQDSSELVTLTPLPTNTPRATEIPTSEDANGIALAFYRAWELNDFLGMYSLLTPGSQALVDSISFVTRYEEAMETATVTQVATQALGALQDGNTAQMQVRVTWQTAAVGAIIREYTVPLAYENGRWGIVWDEGLILPELSGGNTLVMQQRIPARANIYDVNGKALAYQGNILTLGVIPGQIEDEPAMLNALSPMLNLSPEEIKEIYAPALPDWYWPIGDVTEATMQQYGPSIQPFIGKGLAEPKPRLARLFSDSGAAPHLIGYTGYIPAEELTEYQAEGFAGDEIVGLAGLERWSEDYLNGERGGTLTVVGPNGDYITTVQEQEPKQSRSIFTTLDLEFQTAVEQALAEAAQSLGLRAGAAVVLNVNTGKVLAMASYPNYDPRIFDPFAQDSAVALGAAFNDPDRPLLNRPTQGVYPAGSTFKIVTYTAAINSGLYTPDTFYTSTGTWRRLGDNFVKVDWRPQGHGTISLKQALVVSCNSCFYDAAFEMDAMDPNFFPQMALQFGLGQPTGIVGVAEAGGTVPSPEWKLAERGEGWVRGDAVNMGIGQGDVQVTPLQMANIIAAIANGGTLNRPTLIDRIGAGGGAPEEPFPVQANGELPLSPENLAIMQESLWKVANDSNGTATHQFVGLPIQVAGKTGTAEAPPGNSHAWFVGYAPANQPEIAIAVILEHGGEGSAVSAPLFRRIVELYYDITPVTPFPWQS
jgi:penicillin-binding protein 2